MKTKRIIRAAIVAVLSVALALVPAAAVANDVFWCGSLLC